MNTTKAVTGTFASVIGTTDYYVAPSGNDSNNGSFASPWRTLNHAIAAFTLGPSTTVIHLAVGTYSENSGSSVCGSLTIICLNRGGSPTARLVIQGDQPWTVPSSGGALIRSSVSAPETAFQVNGADYIDIVNMDVGNNVNLIIGTGIACNSASNQCQHGNSVHVIHNYFHDMGSTSPYNLNPNFSSPGCVDNGVIGAGQHGSTGPIDTQVISNRIEKFANYLTPPGNCGHGIYLTNQSVLVWNNIVIDVPTTGIEVFDSPCGWVVANNTIVDAAGAGGGASIQLAAGAGNTCQFPGNNTVTNNISYSSRGTAFLAGVVGFGQSCSTGHNTLWENNEDFNTAGTSYLNFQACDIKSGALNVDPKIVNPIFGSGNYGDWHLITSPTSPMIGAGAVACVSGGVNPCVPTFDFDNIARSLTTPSVGAYEQ